MRHLLPVLALTVALTACTATPQLSPPDGPSPTAVRTRTVPPASAAPTPPATVDPADLVRSTFVHLEDLQRIADEAGGTRATGTGGHAGSLAYAERVLTAAGFSVSRQEADAPSRRGGGAVLDVAAAGVDVAAGDVLPMVGSPGTDPAGILAGVVEARTPTGCAAADHVGVRGAIVLLRRGECRFGEKASLAAAAGALGVIIYNDADGPLRGELAGSGPFPPTVGISGGAGRALVTRLATGSVEARLTVEVPDTVPVVNLIAEGPAARSGRVVMLGAHLDSVEAGPGINDNASGVALTLALAEQLAAEDGAAGLRVALWDAEELGLLGSGAYLRGLAPDEVGRISAYINLDMVASPNGLVGVYGDGPARRALEQPLRDGGHAYAGVAIDGASDHAWFDGQGISVAGLYTGAGEPLTAAESSVFGGVADTARDGCYHRACDTVSSVDTPAVRARLTVIADASLRGLRRLLGDASRR